MGIKISYTQNEKYQMSPRSWFLHYMLKLREAKTGSALVFGNAVDQALNNLITNKFDKQDATAEEVFRTAWKKQDINGNSVNLATTDLVKYSKADLDLDLLTDDDRKAIEKKLASPEWLSLQRKGLAMLKAYEEQVLPHLSDLHKIQQYVKIENSEQDQIIGFIDLIAKFKVNDSGKHELDHLKKYNDKLIIFDNKTTSIKYKDDSVATSRQLGTYAEAPNVAEHDYEGYIVIPKKFRKEKEPKIPIQIIIDKVDPEVVKSTFDSYSSTIEGIKLGKFNCTGCRNTPFGCAYKTYCSTDGKDTTGLIYIKDKKDE